MASCKHNRYWLRGDGLFLCCECRPQTSPTAGTVLDKTRLPLSKWLQAITGWRSDVKARFAVKGRRGIA
jgi:hypothetical protein